MSSSNYVVRDVVRHIDDEREYRASRSASHTVSKLSKNLWIFLVIVGLSSGLGFVAVYLPDAMASRAAEFGSTEERMGDLRQRYETMSEAEKERAKELMGQMGIGN